MPSVARYQRGFGRRKPPAWAKLDARHWAGCPTLKYLVNEGGGNLRDGSKSGNTGTVASGATWTPNSAGVALKFNGTSGHVTAAKSNTVQGGACWLSCYVQFTSVGGNLARFIAGQQDSSGQYSCGLVDYDGEVSRGLRFWVKSNVGQSFAETSSITWAAAGKVYRLDGTWDGANIKLYVNGQQNGAGGTLAGGSIVASNPFMLAYDALISGQGVGGKRYLNGYINGVAAYPFAPTAAQVWQLYQRPYDMLIPSGARRGFAGATISGQTLAAGVASISVTDAAPGVMLGTASEQAGVANVAAALSAPTVALGTATAPAGMPPIGVEVAPPPLALGPVTQPAGAGSISLAEASAAVQLGHVAPPAGIADVALAETAPAISLGAATAAAGQAGIGLEEVAPAIAGRAQATNEVWQPRSRGTIWTLLE